MTQQRDTERAVQNLCWDFRTILVSIDSEVRYICIQLYLYCIKVRLKSTLNLFLNPAQELNNQNQLHCQSVSSASVQFFYKLVLIFERWHLMKTLPDAFFPNTIPKSLYFLLELI